MNDTPKISVIVPMYNAEKYLKTCVNSILNQSFTDFELILVDDCSTDKTLDIAKTFQDSRIKILQTEKNSGGCAVPRNLGLDVAKGEFIYFIDADDAIVPQALKILHDKIVETDADIVYGCNWMIPNNPEFTELEGLDGNLSGTSNEPVSKDLMTRVWFELCQNHMNSVVWLNLYRRELFEGAEKIRYPNCFSEDVFVHFDLLCKTDNIVKIESPFYIYRTNPNSITRKKQDISQIIEVMFAINSHIRKKLSPLVDNEQLINRAILSVWNGISSVYLLPAYRENESQILNEVADYFDKNKNLGEDSNSFAFIFYAWLWGQNESIKRTTFRSALQNLMEQNP